jgi:hypothetical protein
MNRVTAAWPATILMLLSMLPAAAGVRADAQTSPPSAAGDDGATAAAKADPAPRAPSLP